MGMTIEEQVKTIKEQLADVSDKYRMMQADYNAKLKADMVGCVELDIIQQKIDALKGEQA